MKLIIGMILVAMFFGCSGIRVNVDLASCEERGSIDGIKIAKCKYIDVR